MNIIDHGHGIVEYHCAIENPAEVIANIKLLEDDPAVHQVLPRFEPWLEGFVQPDGVWRAVNVKGKNKVTRWSDTGNSPELIEARKRAAELVIDPIWLPLKESVHEYSSRFGINVPRTITRNIDIRVYATGQELAPHTDTNTGGPFTHYSLVIYLNDDYEGGEIHFIDSGVKIKPSAGTIVAFPATTLHESIPVSSGEKWHSPCFWYDEVSLVTSGKEPPSIDRFKND